MRYIKSLLIILLVVALTSCSKSPVTLFVNGKIYSLDANNTVYEAMAVRDGKILEIGTTAKIKEKFDTKDVVDLSGKTVIPGFTDMEGSLVEFARNLNFINFSNVKSIEEAQKIISENAKAKKEGSWVVGYALNELNFKEEELLKIDKTILDAAAPNHNVYIVNVTGDMVWTNSKLLQTLQITNLTPNPKDGEIEKNEKGELTGLLFDKAVNLVKEKSPEISKEDLTGSLQIATLELAKYGITEVHDRTVNKESISLFKQIIDSNKLAVKMYGILSAGDETFEEYLSKGIEVNYKDYLTVRAVSIDYDGALNLQAASMNDKYKIDTRNTFLYATDEEIETAYKKALDKGFQFYIKSVGDKAVTNNLNVIEKVLKEKNPKDHRTVLEYIEFISPNDVNRLGALKIIPSVRPEETMSNIEILKDFIPETNSNNVGMWNAMLQSTKYITAGSNFPYSNYISPLTLIHLLVNRQPLDTNMSNIPNLNQKLSVLDAIKAFTVYAAYAGFEEKTKGTLEKDKYADFVVLSDDIFTFDAKKIKDIKVLKTVVNGKIVFGK
ncbi:MAG: amidohydrolase [Ignavibacteriae bacterium]|nr:amidohydrolase [Ignavibacteriota bacterium]